ncbi:imidazolonepropionase [Bernardetia litoralis DSM 6794]|uniref:Imidazolonepropionase n=1 Tax=Bernardetia litoralis (strain ATCC 23117 / DSM 6794 / NBRC 15988 / NCIMB 1366 / Fx l1 / Sio-4) TaxID=880071 RepID=I4AFG7_BERLS|nr:imidazolonepropionase [Bernardetia litoralis]AFM02702.1 imidazolonepropionase [Bernardetia litoralis DSM 6794]
MKKTLFLNIKSLVQVEGQNQKIPSFRAGKDMQNLPSIENAFLLVENGKIKEFGKMEEITNEQKSAWLDSSEIEKIDATGKFILPSFVDSHTHIVYAGSREKEFEDRIHGLTYEEIAQRGGGILNSTKRLQQTSEEELYEAAHQRLVEMIGFGTGAAEIKSGYGLTLEDEIKMLRVIQKLKEVSPIEIKSTFLGAHAFPKEISRESYMDLLTQKMIPQVAAENLADYCDVFCDKGFFTVEETDRILNAATKHNLKIKLHANELDTSGGVQIGVKHGARSVDHLEHMGEDEINSLLNSADSAKNHDQTMPTLLPSTAFFLRLQYAPARKMIESGLPVSLATDYNPGSSPSGNMPFVLSLACIHMQMTPEEAINAATLNAAYAINLEKTHGIIRKNTDANLILTKKIPSLAFMPYSFGSHLIEQVFIRGNKV